ncbi:MAG: hypothetical protein LBS74_00540 [Oscillospiraceae bacterium]|jgi:hypothetical protein|nr:hypothetical protein [Oscillospiraceae bacterium]
MSNDILHNTFFVILGLAVLTLLAAVLLFVFADRKKRARGYTSSAAAVQGTLPPLPVFIANETTKLINDSAPFISSETTQIGFAGETAQMAPQEPNYTAVLNELELELDITLVHSKEVVV